MAVIGPRPLLVKYLSRYNKFQHHRHDVRPGLSGYAQINGRNALTWEDRFKLDILYAKHISFISDMKIIFSTMKIVLLKKGISSGTCETMEEFEGALQ